jgi:hypothetical protein
MHIDTSDGSDFARLRHQFHLLADADPDRREAILAGLDEVDAALAAELRGLLDKLDEADLDAATAEAAPAQLGPFRLLRRIGRGGMGDVYLAERIDGGFEQQVALKRVRETAFSPAANRRFQRERQILARLLHPNIAHLIDGGIGADGRPWLAMEYVQGERITEWCARRALDTAARVRLFLPVCDAVQLAHRNLVVHRDLKPANVLVNAEGRPKLLDFGIARLLEPGDTERTQTSMAMTPAYAAPEQQRGGEITTATDIFQLGRVLQELLTERGPESDSARGAADPALDGARRAAISPRGDLARILAKAQAELPADRYASVAMLAYDLSDWLAARPLRSGIGSARAQTRYLLTRFRWPLGLAATVLITLGLGAAVAWQQAQRAQAQALTAQAYLQSLLDVLGSANSGRFAGREATAGEFLIGAATALQQRAADQPELVRRASVEIAHALINLGRSADAEPLLQTALLAAERDPGAGVDARLAILGLLMHAQDSPAAAPRARISAAQIESLVGESEVATGTAVDALARAGGVLSKQGEFALSQRLFARAEALLGAGDAAVPSGVVENYWRQRGWAALRAADADNARAALIGSLAVIDADPTEFSPLRRAEGEVLLAEAELASGAGELAQQRFEAALPVLLEEYDGEHPERAVALVKRAGLALGGSDLAGPRYWLGLAEPVLLRHASDYAGDLVYIALLRARLAAQQRDCAQARQQLALALQRIEALPQRLPRMQGALATAEQAVTGVCSG